jgi:hypothetical protein
VAADVGVYVFTESLTPDDRAALADARLPTVAVLNKADQQSCANILKIRKFNIL